MMATTLLLFSLLALAVALVPIPPDGPLHPIDPLPPRPRCPPTCEHFHCPRGYHCELVQHTVCIRAPCNFPKEPTCIRNPIGK